MKQFWKYFIYLTLCWIELLIKSSLYIIACTQISFFNDHRQCEEFTRPTPSENYPTFHLWVLRIEHVKLNVKLCPIFMHQNCQVLKLEKITCHFLNITTKSQYNWIITHNKFSQTLLIEFVQIYSDKFLANWISLTLQTITNSRLTI